MVVFVPKTVVNGKVGAWGPVVLCVSVETVFDEVGVGIVKEGLCVEIRASGGEGIHCGKDEETAATIENVSKECDAIHSCTGLEQMVFALEQCTFLELQVCLKAAAVTRVRSAEKCDAGDEYSWRR
jgi:hypothetical protein